MLPYSNLFEFQFYDDDDKDTSIFYQKINRLVISFFFLQQVIAIKGESHNNMNADLIKSINWFSFAGNIYQEVCGNIIRYAKIN